MEISLEVDKIAKCAIYNTVFSLPRLSLIKKNYQGCQFDVHFIQCQTSTDILGIVNEFV